MASHGKSKKLMDIKVVNRWNLDFYVAEALDAFRDDDYILFSQIRDHLQSLLEMPIELHRSLTMKLQVMQFLSRIYDGDKLGTEFEPEGSMTPLESAMAVLESISDEVEIPQSDLERFHTSLREMVVMVCIKSKEFAKAKEMLQKYFPTSTRKKATGKAKLLWDLTLKSCNNHAALEQPTYSQFRLNTLDFIERVYNMPQPFLSKIVEKRSRRPGENATQTEEHADHTPPESQQDTHTPEQSSSAPPPPPSGVVTVAMLRSIYEAAQAQEEGLTLSFTQIMEEVYRESDAQEEEEEETEAQEEEEEEAVPNEQGEAKKMQQQEQQQKEKEKEVVMEVENGEVAEEEEERNVKQTTAERTAEEGGGEEEMEEEEEEEATDSQDGESLRLVLSETPDLEVAMERQEEVVRCEEEEGKREAGQQEAQTHGKEDGSEKSAPPAPPAPLAPLASPRSSAPEEGSETQLDTEAVCVKEQGKEQPTAGEEDKEEEEKEKRGEEDKEEEWVSAKDDSASTKEDWTSARDDNSVLTSIESVSAKDPTLDEKEDASASEKEDGQGDAVVPVVMTLDPLASPDAPDSSNPFSQMDSPSLLAPPTRNTRSRHQGLRTPRGLPPTQKEHDSDSTPDRSGSSPALEPRLPSGWTKSVVPNGSVSVSDGVPVGRTKTMVPSGSGSVSVPDGVLDVLSALRRRYCTVSVAQLVTMPDSQSESCGGSQRSSDSEHKGELERSPDSNHRVSLEAVEEEEGSSLNNPANQSQASATRSPSNPAEEEEEDDDSDEPIRTPLRPLSSTPDRRRLPRQRLRDPLPDSSPERDDVQAPAAAVASSPATSPSTSPSPTRLSRPSRLSATSATKHQLATKDSASAAVSGSKSPSSASQSQNQSQNQNQSSSLRRPRRRSLFTTLSATLNGSSTSTGITSASIAAKHSKQSASSPAKAPDSLKDSSSPSKKTSDSLTDSNTSTRRSRDSGSPPSTKGGGGGATERVQKDSGSSTPSKGDGATERVQKDSSTPSKGDVSTGRQSDSSTPVKGGGGYSATKRIPDSASPSSKGDSSTTKRTTDNNITSPSKGDPSATKRTTDSASPSSKVDSSASKRLKEAARARSPVASSSSPAKAKGSEDNAGTKRQRDNAPPTTPVRPGIGGSGRGSGRGSRGGVGRSWLGNNSSQEEDEEEEEEDPLHSPSAKRRAKALTMRQMMDATATREEWSDEDSIFGASKKSADVPQSPSETKRRRWGEDESRWIKEGVQRFGMGKWEKIRAAYPFKGRTAVNIKDRWRTMQKNN